MRELENALEFAATVCQGQTLQPEDLPPEVLAAGSPRPEVPPAPEPLPRATPAPAPETTGAAAERNVLKAALDANRWSRGETAKALGLSRSTLWRRMRALGLA